MLSLTRLHNKERILIAPAKIKVVFDHSGTAVFSIDETPERVTETADDIAKLIACWNVRNSEAFRAQFGIDRPTQVIASIGWQGSRLVFDIVDIAELREVDQ